MRVDPEVSRLKFDREVLRLQQQRKTLEQRGIFVIGTPEFPIVEVIYVSRHPLRLVVPTMQHGGIFLPQAAMAMVELPNLSAKSFKARFDLTDYDLRAPSLEFRDPWSNALLNYATMLRALEYEKDRKAHVVLLDDHPTTHKPFLCLRGIREYHEHPQHSGDSWLLYRKEMSLFTILLSVWRVTIDLIHPQLTLQPNGIQTIWIAEEKV